MGGVGVTWPSTSPSPATFSLTTDVYLLLLDGPLLSENNTIIVFAHPLSWWVAPSGSVGRRMRRGILMGGVFFPPLRGFRFFPPFGTWLFHIVMLSLPPILGNCCWWWSWTMKYTQLVLLLLLLLDLKDDRVLGTHSFSLGMEEGHYCRKLGRRPAPAWPPGTGAEREEPQRYLWS